MLVARESSRDSVQGTGSLGKLLADWVLPQLGSAQSNASPSLRRLPAPCALTLLPSPASLQLPTCTDPGTSQPISRWPQESCQLQDPAFMQKWRGAQFLLLWNLLLSLVRIFTLWTCQIRSCKVSVLGQVLFNIFNMIWITEK